MKGRTTRALSVAVALALVSVMACSGVSGDAIAKPAADGGNGPQVSPASAKSPTGGLCLPAVPLAVSVGDTWTISGTVNVEGVPTEIPEAVTDASRTFTVDVIGTTSYASGRNVTPMEHPAIELTVTNMTRDSDGNVLSTEEDTRAARGGWTPASVTNFGPALTPDWECHKTAWLSGWPSPAEPSVNERVLSSGVTAVIFTVRQPLLVPSQAIDATSERRQGYDRLTGRLVLQETLSTGTREGEPFTTKMLLELTQDD